jgi:Protein of unknown function (DUF1203)
MTEPAIDGYALPMTDYRITGLAPGRFAHLFGLDAAALQAHGARRVRVEETPGTPDRIEMRDLEPGETALLLNFEHQPAHTPCRSTHAIFIREGATTAYDRVNEVPEVMLRRQLSLRAFDAQHMMIDADVIDGHDAEASIRRFFSNPDVAYIHVHNAKRGCYSGRVDRA